jgi:general secretion pathway protein B
VSIILDALRKSERERRLGQIPTLESGTSPPVSGGRLAARAAVAILTLVLLGGAYWWTRQEPDARPAAAPTASPVAPEPPSALPRRPVESSPTIAATQSGAANPGSGTVELPAAARAQLPPLVLNALSWSEDPKRRFVMINQGIAREGQSLAGGILLREITREGAVLEIQGQRFTLRP